MFKYLKDHSCVSLAALLVVSCGLVWFGIFLQHPARTIGLASPAHANIAEILPGAGEPDIWLAENAKKSGTTALPSTSISQALRERETEVAADVNAAWEDLFSMLPGAPPIREGPPTNGASSGNLLPSGDSDLAYPHSGEGPEFANTVPEPTKGIVPGSLATKAKADPGEPGGIGTAVVASEAAQARQKHRFATRAEPTVRKDGAARRRAEPFDRRNNAGTESLQVQPRPRDRQEVGGRAQRLQLRAEARHERRQALQTQMAHKEPGAPLPRQQAAMLPSSQLPQALLPRHASPQR